MQICSEERNAWQYTQARHSVVHPMLFNFSSQSLAELVWFRIHQCYSKKHSTLCSSLMARGTSKTPKDRQKKVWFNKTEHRNTAIL